MNDIQQSNQQALCLSCGLCCNGTIFARVPLNPADKIAPLQYAGIEIQQKEVGTPKEIRKSFRLPCEAFQNNCCQVYDDRPINCRKFRCNLLKKFESGEILWSDALEKIVSVQQIRDTLRKEVLSIAPEYADVSIPALVKLLPEHGELHANSALLEKWGKVLMLLSALRGRIESDFYPPIRGIDKARVEGESGER